jgi:hypothetical protein
MAEVAAFIDAQLQAIARLAGPQQQEILPIYTLDDVVREARQRADRALRLIGGTDVTGKPEGNAK